MKSILFVILYAMIMTDMGDALTTIDIHPARVTTGLTETLSVRCHFNRGRASNIVYPFSIVLSKSNNSEHDFSTLASVYQYSGPQTSMVNKNKVKVDGMMNGTGSSFLQITYTPPTSKDCGFYKYIVKGIDQSDSVVEEIKVHELKIGSPSGVDFYEQYQKVLGRVAGLEKEMKVLASTSETKENILQKTIIGLQNELNDMRKNVKAINESNQVVTATSKDHMFMNTYKYGNSTYYLSRFGINRAQLGEIACAIYGGYLVEIESLEEYNTIVTSFRSGLKFPGVYVGMTDENTEGHWFNSFSRKPVKFTSWNAGEPNGGTKENCVVLSNTIGFRMADIICGDHYGYYWHFLCEVSNK